MDDLDSWQAELAGTISVKESKSKPEPPEGSNPPQLKKIKTSHAKSIPKSDKDSQKILGEANRLFSIKDYESAQTACFELIRRYPEVVEPYRIILQIAEARGKHKVQLELLILIASLEKEKDVDTYMEVSELAYSLGQTDRAIDFLMKAKTIDSEQVDSIGEQAYLSRLHMEQGKYDLAINDIHPSNFKDKDNQDIALWIAHIYSKYKNDKQRAMEISMEMYEKTNMGQSMSAKNIYQVVYSLYESEKFTQVVEIISNCLDLTISYDPRDFQTVQGFTFNHEIYSPEKGVLTWDVRIIQFLSLFLCSLIQQEFESIHIKNQPRETQSYRGTCLPEMPVLTQNGAGIDERLSTLTTSNVVGFGNHTENERTFKKYPVESSSLQSDALTKMTDHLLTPILKYENFDTIAVQYAQTQIISLLFSKKIVHPTFLPCLDAILLVLEPDKAKLLNLSSLQFNSRSDQQRKIIEPFGQFYDQHLIAQVLELRACIILHNKSLTKKLPDLNLRSAMISFQLAAETYNLMNNSTQSSQASRPQTISKRIRIDYRRCSIVALKAIELATVLNYHEKALDLTKKYILNDSAIVSTNFEVPLANRIPKDIFIIGVLNLTRLDLKEKVEEISSLICNCILLWLSTTMHDALDAQRVYLSAKFVDLNQPMSYSLVECRNIQEMKANMVVEPRFGHYHFDVFKFRKNELLETYKERVNLKILKILQFTIDFYLNQPDTDRTIEVYHFITTLRNTRQTVDEGSKLPEQALYSRAITLSAGLMMQNRLHDRLSVKQVQKVNGIVYDVIREWIREDSSDISKENFKSRPEKKNTPLSGKIRLWKIFSQILNFRERESSLSKGLVYEDRNKNRRFIDRLKSNMLEDENEYIAEDIDMLNLILANMSMSGGSFPQAIDEYNNLKKKQPDNYFLWAMMGIGYVSLVSRKFTSKKNSAMIQAIAFFEKYKDLRSLAGCEQEVFYNIGRAWHQIGFRDSAIQYYRLALQAGPPAYLDKKIAKDFDLSPEIA